MKLKMTLLALMMSSSAFAANANSMAEHAGDFYVGGDLGAFADDHDNQGGIYGIKGGYQLSETFGIEGGYELVDPKGDAENQDAVNLNVLYYPLEGIYNGSYVKAGALYNEDTNKTRGNVGIGRQMFLSDDFAVNTSVAYQFDNESNEAIAKIGFNYYFGSKKDTVQVLPVEVIKEEVEHVKKPLTVRYDYDLSVGFDLGKTSVRAEDKDKIANFAQAMHDFEGAKAQINGFASKVGDIKYNEDLSLQRAVAVKDVLVHEFKVDPDLLVVKGMGVPSPDSANPADDQKVEAHFTVIKTEKVE